MRFKPNGAMMLQGKSWPCRIRTLTRDDAGRARGFGEMASDILRLYVRKSFPLQEGDIGQIGEKAYRCTARVEYPFHAEADLMRCAK